MSEPITRKEMYLAALGGDAVTLPDPLTREELYLAYLNGMTDTYPEPITRTEQYLYTLCQNGMGSGGGVTIRNQNKTITENGTYRHDSGYTGLGPVTVNVPQELPVVEPLEVTENGTYNPPEGVNGFAPVTVNVVASGGGGDVARAIVERTITEYIDSEITTVGNRAFYECKDLSKITLPNLLTTGSECFYGCSSLKEFVSETATHIGTRNFQNCTSLERVYLPLANNNVSTAPGQFMGCSALRDVYIPVWRRPQGSLFKNCVSLEKVDLPMAYELQSEVFSGCVKLKALALRNFANNGVVTLANLNVFTGTPFASGGTGGVLLIPSALVESHKTATNWSVIYGYGTNRFLALEDYTVDGTITGEIDWDKVNALLE